MSKHSTSTSGGVSFLSLLAILFIGLKLGGAIQWSWWYVLMPLWIGPAVIAVVLVPCILVCLITMVVFPKRTP